MWQLIQQSLAVAFSVWIVCNAKVEGYFRDDLNREKMDLSVWHQRNPRVATRNNDQLACERPDIYICEEPPNVIAIESTKTCNFRNVWFHEQVFRWVAGRGCLLYTPNFLYVGGFNPFNLNARCVYGNLFAPCMEIARDDGTCACYPFDPSFEVVANVVRKALVPNIHGRWERCYYEACDCCSHFMNGNSNVQGNSTCPPTFDGWTCWHPAQNGTTARSVCPEFAYSNSGPMCHHFSHKECYPQGVWELQTDYSTCSITPRHLSRYRFYVAVLIFSVITSLPAIIIFISYKRLRATRVALHRNLLIAIVLRSIIVIISRNVIYMDELTNSGETIMSGNSVACRVLSVAEQLSGNAVFVCMLMEGIYLHSLVVTVFKQQLRITVLHFIGALIAILPVIAWSIFMGLYNDHTCWMVYTMDHVQWILDAPRILILLINTVLYIDVLRVLFTIRNSENTNQLNTAKSTLFLMPLFGVQFLLTVLRPDTTNCAVEQFYYFVVFSIEGLQGFIVALLYCYINKEVHALIKATYKKAEVTVTSRIKSSTIYPRISGEPTTDRRINYTSTRNTKTCGGDLKNQYLTMHPKLHVAEITLIQARERLAEILDPVYETIDNCQTFEGNDYLERSDIDNDSLFVRNTDIKVDECYGFTNASSVSMGCPDCLKRVSSQSSGTCNNSLTAYYEVIQEEMPGGIKNVGSTNPLTCHNERGNNNLSEFHGYESVKNLPECDITSNEVIDNALRDEFYPDMHIDYRNYDNMLEDIIQCMESKDNSNVKLNPDLNRPEGDEIVFLD